MASKLGPTDWPQAEASLRELGRPYEWIDPVLRSMPWQGIRALADPRDPLTYVQELGLALEYSLHKRPVRMEVGV